MSEGLHIIVRGRVQGVYFRAFTQKQAVKLGLNGFVRNLATGDVEIIACGDSASLKQLVAWCHKGPMLAKVTEVVASAHVSHEVFQAFDIR